MCVPERERASLTTPSTISKATWSGWVELSTYTSSPLHWEVRNSKEKVKEMPPLKSSTVREGGKEGGEEGGREGGEEGGREEGKEGRREGGGGREEMMEEGEERGKGQSLEAVRKERQGHNHFSVCCQATNVHSCKYPAPWNVARLL